MHWVVCWVAENGASFAVVRYFTSLAAAVGAYEELDALPNSEGVLQSTTEEVAERICAHGTGKDPQVAEQDRARRVHLVRIVLQVSQPVYLHEKLTQAEVVKRAGG